MRPMSDDRLRTEGLSKLYVGSSSAGVAGTLGDCGWSHDSVKFQINPLVSQMQS
jgi:hypothetical protein